MHIHNGWGWMVCLLGLTGMVMFAGCGGSSNNRGPTGPSYTLQQPVPVTGQPSSIGGSVFTMAATASDPTNTVLIDQAANAALTLSGTTAAGAPYGPVTTTSTIRGGYTFSSVPAGTYTVSGTATSPSLPSGVTLSGSVSGVVAVGNVPTLMVNLLLGVSTNMCTFSGQVTQDNNPAGNAIISVNITAHTPDFLTGDSSAESSVILTFPAQSNGTYSIPNIPGGGTDYYIAAHSPTSMMAQTSNITAPTLNPTPNVNNLILTDATTPVFADLTLNIVSATLPSATVAAENQTLISRMAIANALHAPQARINMLQQLYTKTRTMRSISGFIENDLYWALNPATPGQTYVDVGVCGFNIYRGTAPPGPFILTGTNNDPYMCYFFDNDPALLNLSSSWYTVTSCAANGKQSPPATAIEAQPLPQITGLGPANGSSASASTGAFTWASVAGAQSYVVLKYPNSPSFNDTPPTSIIIDPAGATSEPFTASNLQPGTYWWSVAAFNNTDPNLATAASFSAYQQVVVTSP